MNGLFPSLIPADSPETAAAFLLSQAKRGSFVVTLNFELISRALINPDFAAILKAADFAVCDGSGGRLLLKRMLPLSEITRIPGIELGYFTLKLAAEQGKSVFLLGGKEKIAPTAARRLQKDIPSLKIAGVYHGYFSPADLPALRGMIRESGAEIVIVCLGSPLQERWILENRRYLPDVLLYLPLGGSLDVWAGAVRRAPDLFRQLGMEWIWRIVSDPRRLGRLFSAGVNLCQLSCKSGKFDGKITNFVSNSLIDCKLFFDSLDKPIVLRYNKLNEYPSNFRIRR
ncbi:MAG: WecB/TagA/CpsF family glycosyltransferase [Clostridia bacterium]|nr:WecB/TagA/CpsF family glycosyltransferase [Clostridia bacterium]